MLHDFLLILTRRSISEKARDSAEVSRPGNNKSGN